MARPAGSAVMRGMLEYPDASSPLASVKSNFNSAEMIFPAHR